MVSKKTIEIMELIMGVIVVLFIFTLTTMLVFSVPKASAEEVKIDYTNKCIPFSLAGGEILRLRTKITILGAENLVLRARLKSLGTVSTQKVLKSGRVTKKGYRVDDYRHEYINYAFSLGLNDKVMYRSSGTNSASKEFVGLLEAENSAWNIRTRSNSSYWRPADTIEWYWRPAGTYWDFGFCQISNYYHPSKTENKRFYTDWKWQIDQCYKLWRWWTKFYWAKNISRTILRFNF